MNTKLYEWVLPIQIGFIDDFGLGLELRIKLLAAAGERLSVTLDDVTKQMDAASIAFFEFEQTMKHVWFDKTRAVAIIVVDN